MAPPPKVWTRTELEALLDDELPQVREFARDELAALDRKSSNSDGELTP